MMGRNIYGVTDSSHFWGNLVHILSQSPKRVWKVFAKSEVKGGGQIFFVDYDGSEYLCGSRIFLKFREVPVYFEESEGVPDTSQSKQGSQIF